MRLPHHTYACAAARVCKSVMSEGSFSVIASGAKQSSARRQARLKEELYWRASRAAGLLRFARNDDLVEHT
jgi:hypothetical protein